jgi:ankyrin repeat protein
MVEHLIQEGLSVGARDKQGNTATHLAAFRGQSSVVGALLQKVCCPTLSHDTQPS